MSKYTISDKTRKRIEKNILSKFSDEQKDELKKIAKNIEKELI
jgi:hypothetical protein